MPEPLPEVVDAAERISSRGEARVPESSRSLVASLGHLGDAVVWMAGAQGTWPPRPIDDAVEVGMSAVTFERRRSLLLHATQTIHHDVMEGMAAADRIADEGISAIALRDSALSTTAANAVIGLLTNCDASSVTRSDLDSVAWMAAAGSTRDLMRLARADLADPVALLTSIGDHEIALLTGVLLGSAARRTPVLLDCVPSLAAALVAHRLAYRAASWWWCSHRPAHPAADQAIERLDLHPFVDVHLAESGVGPDLALQGIALGIALTGDPA